MKLIQYNIIHYWMLSHLLIFYTVFLKYHIQALKADINATIVTSTVILSWCVSKQEVLALGCMDYNVVVAFAWWDS